MAAPIVLAITALPATADPSAFVRTLLEARLIACGTILGGARSVFRWAGAVEEAAETVVLLKTTQERLSALQDAVVVHHPYEVPELLVFPAAEGLPAYLGWIRDEVGVQAAPDGARNTDSIV